MPQDDDPITLKELIEESLVQKHIRLRQNRCIHPEMFSAIYCGPEGTIVDRICLECLKKL